jgi:hypothetical protein
LKTLLFTITSLITMQLSGQAPPDSVSLPFAIAHEKRLSDEDLANKKEGTYVTGVPDLSSDPVNGFGYGGEGSLFFNGRRTDPFFAYTAYRSRIDLVLFNTSRSQREIMLKLDVPYVFNTRWRLRIEGGYESNPNLLYFGTTEESLKGLGYYPHNDSSRTQVTNVTYSKYRSGQEGINEFYNTYIKKEFILNVSAERSFYEGKVRALVGYEVADFSIQSYAGNSLLKKEYEEQKIRGYGSGVVSICQLGLIYDTRDLETDPGNGIFAEITNELSVKGLGSAYGFNKTYFHFNLYTDLLRKRVKKLVLAFRIAGGYTHGDAPFFEYQDQWSSEGSVEGLGGAHTLRGYKQSRFLGRIMTFNNVELRYRFAQLDVWKQHFAFVAVPFLDAGGVWDKFANLNRFQNYRYSEGIGLRIAWNVNSILRFDYAFSKEDQQFFFNLSHAF